MKNKIIITLINLTPYLIIGKINIFISVILTIILVRYLPDITNADPYLIFIFILSCLGFITMVVIGLFFERFFENWYYNITYNLYKKFVKIKRTKTNKNLLNINKKHYNEISPYRNKLINKIRKE